MADREITFKEKLKSINFGVVPGGYRDSTSESMFDKDALLDQIGHPDGRGSKWSEERVRDAQSDFDRKNREATDQVLGG